MKTRTTKVILSLVCASVLLAGCTQQPKGSEMDAEQARDGMVSLVKQTMDAAGGDWTSLSDIPVSSECSTANVAGVTFSWDQERAGSENPESLVRAVAKTWKQHDYDVTIRQDTIDDGRPLWSAVTTGQAVESISVNASPRRVSIEVQSACGTGDIADYE